MKKGWLIALLLELLACQATFAGEGCVEAQRLTKQAESQANVGDRLESYMRARALCPADPYTHYRAGMTLMASGKYADAGKALEDANARFVVLEQNTADTKEQMEIREKRLNVFGRIAENVYRSGDRVKALANFEAARNYAKKEELPLPDWFVKLLKHFDQQKSENPLSQNEMHASVRGMRDLGVEPAVDYLVLFDYDSDQPTAEGKQLLHKIAESFKSETGTLRIIGHTDKHGGKSGYNQQLSERRAKSVAALLAAEIPSLKGRVQTLGKGMDDLKYPGDTEEDHKMNRRVEFVFGNF